MARKLALTITIVIVALVSFLERIGYQESVLALKDSMERRLTTTGVTLASLAAEAISMNFYSFLQEAMATLKEENPDIQFAMIIGSDGMIMAHTEEERTMELFDQKLVSKSTLQWKDHALVYQVPVELGEAENANLMISLSTSFLSKTRTYLIRQSFYKLLSIIGIGFLLSVWLGKRFVQPIVTLSSDAETIASGNLDHQVETRYQDEVGSLASSFEQMRSSLKTRYNEIMTLNKTLDAKVVERTEDLHQTLIKVEEANHKIMDSIHYATTIQKALLPNPGQTASLLADFFAIWQPRDEVGGDIYYINQHQGKVVIVLIDCTGHGVPGALMTMLAMSALNRILSAEDCLDPGQILSRMNVLVKTTLKQQSKDSISDDGLEACACVYDGKARSLSFASARLSAFLVLSGKLLRVKGDRTSIGYRRSKEDFVFTKHDYNLSKGDRLYLFTDGFFEQMAADKNKPFGFKRLQKMLNDLQPLPFKEHKSQIAKTYSDYRGARESQDDVTVLGVLF
ncbi:MAG: hypothetical protein CR997_09410 [Acidobacteria bacterium]|nr:MAG: hypothetical protein CR997_09410 [Acidobacteriota bacterium]